MAKIRFLLKKPKSEEKTLILLVYRSADKKMVYSLSEYILPSEWDFNEQSPRSIKGRGDLSELRYKIKNAAQFLESTIRKWENNGNQISESILKNELNIYFKKSKSKVSVFDFVNQTYLKNKGDKNKTLMISAVRKMESIKSDLVFSDITPLFFDKLHSRLRKENASQNTIKNYLAAVIRLCHAADKELNISISEALTYKHDDIPAYEKVKKVVLSEQELEKLYKHKTDNANDRHVIDAFIVMAYTGVRVKDATQSTGINFDASGYYTKDTSKTGKRIIVPQHSFVKEIIERRSGFSFPKISRNTFTSRLRRILRDVGIDDKISYSMTRGGERVVYVKEKWELVSFHTARRSFATNLHKAGIPAAVAMKFTGHKSIQQYMDYIMISEEEAAEEYLTHRFFTGVK